MELFETEGYKMLLKSLVLIDNEKDCAQFLEDLMTRKELADIAQRIVVAKMLSEQAVYTKIVEETGASTATISRVNRSFLYGAGGYAKTLAKLKEEEV